MTGDVPKNIDRRTDERACFAIVTDTARKFPHPGISGHAIDDVVAGYCRIEQQQNTGMVRATLKFMAAVTGYSMRHLQRVNRWLEAHGLFDVMNEMIRVEGFGLYRRNNIYVIAVDAAPVPLSADVPGADVRPAPRTTGGLARLAALFGLVARPRGLNTTALRAAPS